MHCVALGFLWLLVGQQAAPPPPEPQRQAQLPPAAEQPVSFDQLPFSLDQIRDLLKQEPSPNLLRAGVHFRVEIHGRRFTFPDFKDSLDFRGEPIPPHGLYHYEFLQMVTPPEFRASTLIGGPDMLAAGRSLVASITQAWREREERKIHEEVLRELAAIKQQQQQQQDRDPKR
jgi:hypothetical protein